MLLGYCVPSMSHIAYKTVARTAGPSVSSRCLHFFTSACCLHLHFHQVPFTILK